MKINKALKLLMKREGVTQKVMAERTGRESANRVGATLNSANMRFDTVVQMLDALGYEIALQKKGSDYPDQIIVDQKEEAH